MSALPSCFTAEANEAPPRLGVARIDVWGLPAGYALPGRAGVRFVAVSPWFAALEGARFATLGHARLAAIAQARSAPLYAGDWED